MSVYRYHKGILVSLLLLLASSISGITLAAPAATAWQQERTLHTAAGGLLYSLPQIDREQLGDEVSRLHLTLEARQRQLTGELDKSRLTAGDAVLVAVLPGGLLYAALKRHRTVRAEAELQQIAAQLEELEDFPRQAPPASPLLAAR